MGEMKPQINLNCEYVGISEGVCDLIEGSDKISDFESEERQCLPCLAGLFTTWIEKNSP